MVTATAAATVTTVIFRFAEGRCGVTAFRIPRTDTTFVPLRINSISEPCVMARKSAARISFRQQPEFPG
jgi:hypothetical protein